MKPKASVILTLIFTTTVAMIVALEFATEVAAEADKPHVQRSPAQSNPPPPEMLEDEVLVKYLEKNLPPMDSPERLLALERLGKELSSTFGVTILSTIVKLGMHHMKIPVGEPLADVIEKVAKHPTVEVVEPVYIAHILSSPQPPPPDDPRWTSGDLWGMDKIGMKRLWNAVNLDDKVVAVIDTGIDYGHPDWIRIDMSKNLWTDSSTGKFGPNYCNNGNPPDDPMDDEGHGTAVAGVIGAVGNNTRDVAGMHWKAKIMAVKAFCINGAGSATAITPDLINGIIYAVDKGAWIINNSWDIGTANSAQLRSAINYANQHDVLFVAAAGNRLNDNDFAPTYPANYALDNVIAVAATNERDQLWIGPGSMRYGSNWGMTTVHIAAPGDGIYSLQHSVLGGGTSGNDGTSMAAPHVAGCAALMQAGQTAPLSPKWIRDRINATGDTVACLEGMVINAKRLNCYMAVSPPKIPFWWHKTWEFFFP